MITTALIRASLHAVSVVCHMGCMFVVSGGTKITPFSGFGIYYILKIWFVHPIFFRHFFRDWEMCVLWKFLFTVPSVYIIISFFDMANLHKIVIGSCLKALSKAFTFYQKFKEKAVFFYWISKLKFVIVTLPIILNYINAY